MLRTTPKEIPQRWRIILPHDRLEFRTIRNLGESLFDGSLSDMVTSLAIPVTEWIEDTCDGQASPTDSTGASSSSPFLSLPPELHSKIFCHLSAYADIFCLALVNLHLWHIGRRELKKAIRSVLSPLAHKSLICVGQYHTTTSPLDYPADLLTPSEEDELRAGLHSDNSAHGKSTGAVNLYQLAEARYGAVIVEHDYYWPRKDFHFRIEEGKRTPLSRIVRTDQHNFPEPERSQALALASPDFERFYPGDDSTEWVLRNLTTQEFVRAEDLALRPELVDGPIIGGVGFGEVVLARICWSSDPATGVWGDEELHRGVWAGDCLDIVTEERFRMEEGEGGEGGDGWEDVSEEVQEEMGEIWKGEFGKGWMEEVLKKQLWNYGRMS